MMNMKLLYVAVSILVFLSTTISDVDGILCLKKNNPEHIRLALQPNGVTISWTTSGYLGADDTPKPQVKYDTDQNALSNISPIGFTTTYNPLLIFKRFFHNVRLDGLQPSTKYYYRIEATKICVKESGIYSFITAPSTDNSAQQPINISIVGDLGLNNYFNQYQAEKTIAAMQQYISTSNFFMHIGDISYADLYGVVVNFDFYEDTWNRFQKAIEPITSAVPYQVLPGNHEATCFQYSDAVCPSFLRNFTVYNNRFCMSGELSGGYKNMWYSYDYGPVHVIMINTETDFEGAPAGPGTTLNAGNYFGTTGQLAWLKNDLEKATTPERLSKVPWIIVAGHRPFFGSTVKAQVEIGNYNI
jgi:hypothetical protein